jgi:cytochrome c-type biogenesis protein CcmF
MAEFGTFTLLLALAAATWSAVTAVLGHRSGDARLVRSAAAGLNGALLSLTVAMGVLLTLFLTRDFSVRYVAEYSDSHLPIPYTVAAVWAGQNGSLLFWAWVLAGAAALTGWRYRDRHRELLPIVLFVLALVLVAFTALVVATSNPFQRLGFTPSEGAGLNAMLQNWGQLYHPPATFLGYVGFTVPFAFSIAALVTGRLDTEWVRAIRPWVLWSWILLGLGILLGARWAYTELGWGGYWAWDPVENVSLLPWLTATAYLHSAVLQERRDKLRISNLVLVIATFALTVFGTFLVRSGVASSVHAFAESSAGMYLLGVIVAVVVAGAVLITWRLPLLRSSGAPIGGWSRETMIVVTNGVLIAYTLAIFWGTLFPVITSVLQGRDVTVGEPFFDRVTVPVTVALLVLFGLAPALAWRRAANHGLQRRLAVPIVVGLLAGLVAAVLDGGANPSTTVVLSLAAFALSTIVLEFHHGVHAHGLRRDAREHLPSLLAVFGRNPRRFGGAVVHLGVVLLIVGVALDVTYQRDDRVTMTVGDTVEVDRYTLTFESLDSEITQTRMALSAMVGVARTGGSDAGALVTERYLNVNQEQPRTHVGVRSLLREDVYVILEEVDVDSETATFTVLLHPGLLWLWLGGTLTLVGGLLAVLCGRRRRAAEDAAAVGGMAAQPVAVGVAGVGVGVAGAGAGGVGVAGAGAGGVGAAGVQTVGAGAQEPRSPDLDGPIEPWEDR